MLKQSASGHRPCRAKRETCEKGTMWTDWIPTSFSPSRSSRLSRQAILRECVPVVPHVRTIEVLLCRNGFFSACEAGNCCYRSFASVASKVFILLRAFSSPASPNHHWADRPDAMVAYARSLSGIAVRDEAKEVRLDARPQARKNRRCIRWNTLRIFSGRARRRWPRIVRRSRTVNVGQAPKTSQRGTDWNPQWTGLSL